MTHQTIFAKIMGQDPSELDYDGEFHDMHLSTHEFLGRSFAGVLCNNDTSRKVKKSRRLTLDYLTAIAKEKLKFKDYDAHFGALEAVFAKDNEIDAFISEANQALSKDLPSNFSEEVIQFHKRKNKAQKSRIRRFEIMSKIESEIADNSTGKFLRNKSFSTYETSETLIRNLLEDIEQTSKHTEVSAVKHTYMYRRKQMKFGYALMYTASKHIVMIASLLDRLKKYDKLEAFEVKFIEYVYFESDDARLEAVGVYDTIEDDFTFAIERYIIRIALKVLANGNKSERDRCFEKLQETEEFTRLKERCMEDNRLNCKVKNMIYQLYYFATCNENLLILCDVLE